MKRAAIYIRVSTERQDAENQLPSIEAYAEHEELEITGRYAEAGTAWKNGHQPELARLLDDLRSGRRVYDYLIVWAADRLTRGGVIQLLTLLQSFERLGCRVVSVQEPILGTDNAMRDVFAAFLGWVAKYESDHKSARIREGNAATLRKGVTKSGREIKQLGRPKGSTDKQPRHKAGYLRRWAGKKAPGPSQAQKAEVNNAG